MLHTPKYCGIYLCKTEAECFIEFDGIEHDTLYLCRDHAEKISEEYEPVWFPELTNRGIEIKEFEIGEYSCHEDCKQCNV